MIAIPDCGPTGSDCGPKGAGPRSRLLLFPFRGKQSGSTVEETVTVRRLGPQSGSTVEAGVERGAPRPAFDSDQKLAPCPRAARAVRP